MGRKAYNKQVTAQSIEEEEAQLAQDKTLRKLSNYRTTRDSRNLTHKGLFKGDRTTMSLISSEAHDSMIKQ